MSSSVMIQRYCSANHRAIRGQEPFIVTGPKFTTVTTTTKLIAHEWKFRPGFLAAIQEIGSSADQLSRSVAAELLLREGIVAALWVVNGERIIPESDRWSASIMKLADEIPNIDPLPYWTIELLSGMSDHSYYRNYLSESDLDLQPFSVPEEL